MVHICTCVHVFHKQRGFGVSFGLSTCFNDVISLKEVTSSPESPACYSMANSNFYILVSG